MPFEINDTSGMKYDSLLASTFGGGQVMANVGPVFNASAPNPATPSMAFSFESTRDSGPGF